MRRLRRLLACALLLVPVYVDVVALMRSRAQATVIVGSALVPPQKAEELRLAPIVAGRMATAMRP